LGLEIELSNISMEKNKTPDGKKKITKILITITYIVVIIFAFLAISSKFSIGGFRILIVMSGSMEPAIKTGSVVIDKNITDYQIGDVITFKNENQPKETTTHRIHDIKCQDGNCLYITKGDANDGIDSESVESSQIVGKTLISIPYFGYVVKFARTLPGLLILIVMPATIIVYEEMKKLYREICLLLAKRRR
jgi:signal peptidase